MSSQEQFIHKLDQLIELQSHTNELLTLMILSNENLFGKNSRYDNSNLTGVVELINKNYVAKRLLKNRHLGE